MDGFNMQNNHNNFCIYCGAKLIPNQHFCSQCGHEVYHDSEINTIDIAEYETKINDIEKKYNIKQSRAKELLEKLFDPSHISYSRFSDIILKSNQLFSNQISIVRKMLELEDSTLLIQGELDNKIKTLKKFIYKMEDLINEMVIQLSSNKNDNEDINNLFKEMDDLIESVKDY
ncbi:MAG: zinc ribbon domain-containing protein [Methanobrevibacter thaueri]|nr:zinc ribbon domain-containing protein [Methanobrevibacter thaueri]